MAPPPSPLVPPTHGAIDVARLMRLVRDVINYGGHDCEVVAVNDEQTAWRLTIRDAGQRVVEIEIRKGSPAEVRAAVTERLNAQAL